MRDPAAMDALVQGLHDRAAQREKWAAARAEHAALKPARAEHAARAAQMFLTGRTVPGLRSGSGSTISD
jgi:hypothetical protein